MAMAIVLLLSVALVAQPRVVPPGTLPDDTRPGPLRGEQGDFSFKPSDSPDEWARRVAEVRRNMRVALGLWPMPGTSVNPVEGDLVKQAVIHGLRDMGDYTIEKVYFQSLPEFYLTGNLYRPKARAGKLPAVLSPHGHFPGGRFIDSGLDAVRQQIAQGAEEFEEGGRSFMQARCVQLARMGCVVFHYDMVGYGDSQQISLETAHKFSRSRIPVSKAPDTGFHSAQAELWLFNPMGLHTYNSIRALDFLAGLPDVDAGRIAVTGESGGGTQTFMLCALDDRPRVSVPVVIVSADRQGGCTCENISGLRIGNTNLEFTALHAPKPLLLISADDATRTMPQRGYPELARQYQVLGASGNLAHEALLQFPHNFNYVSRAAMYRFLNKHLALGLAEPIVERDYQRLTQEELTVWNAEHPQPPGGEGFDHKLLAWWRDDAQRQLAELVPRDPASLERYRRVVGAGWRTLLRTLPPDADVRFDARQTREHSTHRETLGLCRYRTVEGHRAELPVVWLEPAKRGEEPALGRRIVVWLDGQGKSGLYAAHDALKPEIAKLLDRGIAVVGVDLLDQGEFIKEGPHPTRQRWLEGEQAFAGWTYCYNMPLAARRIHDVLALIEFARGSADRPLELDLVGIRGAGHLAAAAAALAAEKLHRLAIDTQGFRFAALADVYDVNFLPGAARYHDLPGLLALCAPLPVWLSGEGGERPQVTEAAFRASGAEENLQVATPSPAQVADGLTRWLLK
jgi:dienelactone hydrolase